MNDFTKKFNRQEKIALIYILGNAILAAYPEKFPNKKSDEELRQNLASLIMKEIARTDESELRILLNQTNKSIRLIIKN